MQTGMVEIVGKEALQLQIDETMHEMKPHGTEAFPFQCYDLHIDWSSMRETAWHWHEELELLIIQSGTMICSIGEHSLPLQEGDCILISGHLV